MAKETILAKIIARAGKKRVYAFGPNSPCELVRFAIRKGQAALPGEPVVDEARTHACVEGDAGWTDLTTGEVVRSAVWPWIYSAGVAPASSGSASSAEKTPVRF